MIIVLLLFFNSICLYCQRLILHIHDRWINPQNARLLKEATEAQGYNKWCTRPAPVPSIIVDSAKTKGNQRRHIGSNLKRTNSYSQGIENCRFCANTPQGYCRHHFHLQELQIQKQKKKLQSYPNGNLWSFNNNSKISSEYRQLRQIKRELKQSLLQKEKVTKGF